MKKTILALLAALSLGAGAMAQPKVVAHRGYWRAEGCAQNSIASLRAADRAGCYGSELDVHLTADGVPVVFHDDVVDGKRIEDTPYAALMNHRLANGEFLPTLQQYLQEGVSLPGTRLIVEIKAHSAPAREDAAVDTTLSLVRALGLRERVEYISFSERVCQRLHAREPEAKVAFLGGGLPPARVREMGLTGIDYHTGVFAKHPEWLSQAGELGLEVNVWTVDGEKALRRHAAMRGVDIITTNDPELLQQVIRESRGK